MPNEENPKNPLSPGDSTQTMDSAAAQTEVVHRSKGPELPRGYFQSILESLAGNIPPIFIEARKDGSITPIGEGRFSHVLSAEYQDNSGKYRRCAVKVLRPGVLDHTDSEIAEYYDVRFMSECFYHPQIFRGARNIVEPYVFGAHDEFKFIVLEKMHKYTLREIIRHYEDYSLEARLKMIVDIGHALEDMHQMRLMHRDLSPGNIYFPDHTHFPHDDSRSLGRDSAESMDYEFELDAKLGDFSFVKTFKTTEHDRIYLCGTPHYVAPEQILNSSSVDVRSDVHALGAIAYELITGYKPRILDSDEECECPEFVYRIARTAPTRFLLPDEEEKKLEPIIMRAISSNPSDRYQTMKDFNDAIKVYHYNTFVEPRNR